MRRGRCRDPMAALEVLIESDWLWERLPTVDRHGGPGPDRYPGMVREIVARRRLSERSEWNCYGSGDASFVDVWLYRDAEPFRRPRFDGASHSFTGRWVALCRFAPCCVVGEGEVSWSATHGARYMPSFSGVDVFATAEVGHLAEVVEHLLAKRGVVRLGKSDVSELLPEGTRFPTNLGQGPLRIFDALFFWND